MLEKHRTVVCCVFVASGSEILVGTSRLTAASVPVLEAFPNVRHLVCVPHPGSSANSFPISVRT